MVNRALLVVDMQGYDVGMPLRANAA